MRRWLSILLLVLLPFQFSWAAVAGYCGQDAGVAVAGVAVAVVGQHAHQPDAALAGGCGLESCTEALGHALALDGGHDHCHGHVVAAPPTPRCGLAAEATPERFSLSGRAHADEGPRPRPERPQWRCLA